jgi:molybdate transport system substrate-binding protein
VAFVLALAAAFAFVGCQPTFGRAPAPTGPELTIYAAASLASALRSATEAYAAGRPGVTFAISTDSSSALEAKIEQAAPADLFLSADEANPAKLAASGLGATPVRFAANAPVVVVPRSNPAAIATPADLARPGVKVVAAADGVPITTYAAKLIGNLGREPGYPADFAARYEANVVSREDNVGGVLAKVALGEADAGIVYATDARSSPQVRAIAIPAGSNVVATYAGSVILSSPHRTEAAAFLAWLAGSGGRAVLEPLGFLAPS